MYWFSRSALPPKPPMRSRPDDEAELPLRLRARFSSPAVGPSFASRAISSVTICSICASDAPGRAVAMTANMPEISMEFWNEFTLEQSCLS